MTNQKCEKESAPHPDLLASPHVKIYALAPPPAILRSGAIPFVVSGPLKVLWQICTLFRALAYRTPAARWLLVQVCCVPNHMTRNPPPPFFAKREKVTINHSLTP